MQEIRFLVPAQAIAVVEEQLYALGSSAVTLLEAGDVEFYEPLPGEMPLWPESLCCALFEDASDPALLKAALEHQLGQPLKDWQVLIIVDTDWQRQLMANFQAQGFGEQQKIWIVPSWCDIPNTAKIYLRLDPGLAFGTGEHPTTALCLAWLADQQHTLIGKKLLDYGCGSGILGIAAGKLGASALFAVDNDPQALAATGKNAKANSIVVKTCLPEALTEQGFDLIIANIYSRILLDLAEEFRRLLHPNGLLVLSGIWAHQTETVASRFGDFWQIIEKKEKEGWGLLSLMQKQSIF